MNDSLTLSLPVLPIICNLDAQGISLIKVMQCHSQVHALVIPKCEIIINNMKILYKLGNK